MKVIKAIGVVKNLWMATGMSERIKGTTQRCRTIDVRTATIQGEKERTILEIMARLDLKPQEKYAIDRPQARQGFCRPQSARYLRPTTHREKQRRETSCSSFRHLRCRRTEMQDACQRGIYFLDGPQTRSCCIQRVTYEGQFSMVMFLVLAEQRNTTASRSTKVTFARSSDTAANEIGFSASRRSISGRYSFVSCPHNRIFRDDSFSGIGVIFNTGHLHKRALQACHQHVRRRGSCLPP